MKKFPINFSKFGNVVVFSMMCCSFIFIMVYGKVLHWYSHPYIRMATIVCVVFTLLFVYLERTRRSPYFLLSTLKLRSVQGGILLFLGLMIFNSSAMFVTVFVSVGMKIDNWQNATLGNWVLVGYFLGLVMAVICSAKGFHLKWLFSLGFLLIGLSALYMYFEVQDAGMYERMKWPIIIRATGMMLLYALTAVYANQRMPYRYMSTWVCIMLTVRMIIGPGIGSALYSNVLQERQQHYVTRFSQDFDRMESKTVADYQRTVQGMMYQGKSETEAQQMAAMSLKGKVQVQATLTAIKEMAGWTFYGCLICAGVVLLVPWRKKRLEKVLADIKPKYLSRNKAV